MENFVFTFLRTEGMATIMELNNVELLNQYCVAVVDADAALCIMSLDRVGKSLSAIEAVKELIFDKSCDITEHEDALDEVVDNLEEVAAALRVLECELEDELADEADED